MSLRQVNALGKFGLRQTLIFMQGMAAMVQPAKLMNEKKEA